MKNIWFSNKYNYYKKMIILFEKYDYEFEFSTKYATVADYAFCIYS